MIDGYNLGLEKGTGVATYARNLSYSLHRLGHEVSVLYATRSGHRTDLMREIAFFDTASGKPSRAIELLNNAVDVMKVPLGAAALRVPIGGRVVATGFKSRLPYFDHILASRDVFRRAQRSFTVWSQSMHVMPADAVDIAHWTYPLPIRCKFARNVYTMHDLVPLRLPYTTLDNKRRYYAMCRMIARTADHIVTVSEASRKDIIELLELPEDRVTNTYQTVEIPKKYSEKPVEEVASELLGSFGLNMKGYFLFYGAIEPKKNIGRLIEAYLGSGVETPLVIVGPEAWKSEQELKLLYDDHIRSLIRVGDETRVKKKVMRLDYVTFPMLVSLIRGAKATLFPSLYEGFGLPVVESMLLGTPVLTADTSCLPEIAGDAALSVDPYDVRQITAGIRALDSDAELRGSLAAKGTKQARKFDASVVDGKLATVYEKASRKPSRREQLRRMASEIPFDASAIADWFRI